MKKIYLLCNLLFCILVLTACLSENNSGTPKENVKNNKNKIESSTSYSEVWVQGSLSQIQITESEALEIYRNHYPETVVTSFSLEKYKGSFNYRIEGVDNSREYGLDINADDGSYQKKYEKKLDFEDRNGRKRNVEELDLENILPIQKIGELAQKAAGQGMAEEFELEKDLGLTYWDVKIVRNYSEITVKINAHNGEILEVEYEN